MAAANSALGEIPSDGSGFELEEVQEAEEVLTQDAEVALTAADIVESCRTAEEPAARAAEADDAAPQIHMDLYCGVLEEKPDQDESVAATGVLKLPGGGVLAPPAVAAVDGSSSDDEVIITSRRLLAESDSDSDDDSDSDTAGAGLQRKVLEIESSSLIPGLPDPTDRTLIDKCVPHEAHERDVMQHVEETVRWHRRQGAGISIGTADILSSKCVEIVDVSGTDGAYKLVMIMSISATEAQPGQECRQTVVVRTRRTADGGLEVTPSATE
jgi:hypothetical protein